MNGSGVGLLFQYRLSALVQIPSSLMNNIIKNVFSTIATSSAITAVKRSLNGKQFVIHFRNICILQVTSILICSKVYNDSYTYTHVRIHNIPPPLPPHPVPSPVAGQSHKIAHSTSTANLSALVN